MANFDIDKRIRKNIREMKPYSSARDEFKGKAEVFLDANENPFESPYNRYPDPLQLAVKNRLAKVKNVDVQNIFLGNGSDEPIDLLIRAFCEPNRDSILITEPTYGMYQVCANVNAVNVQSATLTAGFDIDMQSINRSIDASTKLIFLCSPNNPSGNLLSSDKIRDIIERFDGIVVIDEAYIDFAQTDSFVESLEKYSNLVVLQTFSKAWGLAGLRLGMAFASRDIIRVLNKIKYPYNVSIETQRIAIDALDQIEIKNEAVETILVEREKLQKQLQTLSLVERVYPSDANFLLVKVKNAVHIYETLMSGGIIVRDRSRVKLCDNCLRITVGTPQENQTLVQALKTL